MTHSIKKVAVLGAGTMGAGIAQVFAQSEYDVLLYDIQIEALEKARQQIERSINAAVDKGKLTADKASQAIKRITVSNDFNLLKVDLVIEAVVENLEIKRKLFRDIAAQNPVTTILATNTSSIPVTQIAAGVPHPERVVGIHFFNPAHIMKLVEIISGAQTSPQVAQTCRALIDSLGKTTVHAKDAPGFIVNRVARHYYVEALKMMEENVASFETIDELAESSGFKLGPFKLMDLIGVDTNFSVTTSVYHLFHQDGKFRPSRIQQQKVDAGHWGRKTKQGFYSYE
ncbi:MAG: 3-hydroxybutyryl-CoA dehydrogenase [Bacteroidia bacterium]|nr:3-hydroxybutyryl-CoA dehydrogenase [Bacteroidia bacterium]MBP7261623.1 3-hydroxybutyryl-CoA dehydrogenase [Bacteroidia bacterium]MBP9180648.1 3-hydroxybutyryl-CoA dehydrogenase [Bacteroidia bacterium]MBP9724896.1 3-hydroxybutyryl-CoA dehydrogenase [Bacteroidia bacterium]